MENCKTIITITAKEACYTFTSSFYYYLQFNKVANTLILDMFVICIILGVYLLVEKETLSFLMVAFLGMCCLLLRVEQFVLNAESILKEIFSLFFFYIFSIASLTWIICNLNRVGSQKRKEALKFKKKTLRFLLAFIGTLLMGIVTSYLKLEFIDPANSAEKIYGWDEIGKIMTMISAGLVFRLIGIQIGRVLYPSYDSLTDKDSAFPIESDKPLTEQQLLDSNYRDWKDLADHESDPLKRMYYLTKAGINKSQDLLLYGKYDEVFQDDRFNGHYYLS